MTYQSEANECLRALSPDATDNEMAATAADVLLSALPGPYRIAIDHHVGAPYRGEPEKFNEGFCLLDYTWRHKNVLGIHADDRDYTARWIKDALCFGYEVSRLSNVVLANYTPISGPYTIARLRIRAKAHGQGLARPGKAHGLASRDQPPTDNEDEVPF